MVQWVHVMAVSIWVGGLVWLLLGLRREPLLDRRSAVKRFSTTAGIALGVVVATGAVRAMVEVGSLHGLFSSSYGTALLVKVALVIVIVLLGALQRYARVPALVLDDRAPRALSGLLWTGREEVVVASLIFAATAVLTGLAPTGVVR
jgi:copper transport protein